MGRRRVDAVSPPRTTRSAQPRNGGSSGRQGRDEPPCVRGEPGALQRDGAAAGSGQGEHRRPVPLSELSPAHQFLDGRRVGQRGVLRVQHLAGGGVQRGAGPVEGRRPRVSGRPFGSGPRSPSHPGTGLVRGHGQRHRGCPGVGSPRARGLLCRGRRRGIAHSRAFQLRVSRCERPVRRFLSHPRAGGTVSHHGRLYQRVVHGSHGPLSAPPLRLFWKGAATGWHLSWSEWTNTTKARFTAPPR